MPISHLSAFALFSFLLAQTAHAKGLLTTKSPWLQDGAYGLLIKDLCFAKLKSSLAALFKMQAFFHDLGFPLGDKGAPVFVKVFHELYESDIITEDCLHAWRDDIHNPAKGHDKALQQTMTFFDWLDNAEEEEGEGDEAPEEDEALKGILRPNNRGKLH